MAASSESNRLSDSAPTDEDASFDEYTRRYVRISAKTLAAFVVFGGVVGYLFGGLAIAVGLAVSIAILYFLFSAIFFSITKRQWKARTEKPRQH